MQSDLHDEDDDEVEPVESDEIEREIWNCLRFINSLFHSQVGAIYDFLSAMKEVT